jgi:hypothetical protein
MVSGQIYGSTILSLEKRFLTPSIFLDVKKKRRILALVWN